MISIHPVGIVHYQITPGGNNNIRSRIKPLSFYQVSPICPKLHTGGYLVSLRSGIFHMQPLFYLAFDQYIFKTDTKIYTLHHYNII